MELREAIRSIIGEKAANAIIADRGEHWAFTAAVAAAKNSDNPKALLAISKRLREIRDEREAHK